MLLMSFIDSTKQGNVQFPSYSFSIYTYIYIYLFFFCIVRVTHRNRFADVLEFSWQLAVDEMGCDGLVWFGLGWVGVKFALLRASWRCHSSWLEVAMVVRGVWLGVFRFWVGLG